MKYIIFEKSAIDKLINEEYLQSYEYELSQQFVDLLKNDNDGFSLMGMAIKKDKDGLIFCGPGLEKTFLMIDMEQCDFFEIDDEKIEVACYFRYGLDQSKSNCGG